MKNHAKHIIEYYKNNRIVKTVDTQARVSKPELYWPLEIKDRLDLGTELVTVGTYSFVTKCHENSGFDFTINKLVFETEDVKQNLIDHAQNHVIRLESLSIIPLSTQLQRITGDSYNLIDFNNVGRYGLSAEPGNVIYHIKTGLKFRIPA